MEVAPDGGLGSDDDNGTHAPPHLHHPHPRPGGAAMTTESTPSAPDGDADPTLELDGPAHADDTVLVTGIGVDDAPPPPPGPHPRSTPSPGSPEAPAPRRLYRRRDGNVAGVAGGIADYFGIDPVIVRLGFVLATFIGGAGVVAYLVGWIIIPKGDGPEGPRGPRQPIEPVAVAAGLLVLGAIAIGFSDPLESSFWIPFLLVGAGVYLLVQRPRADEPLPTADGSVPRSDGATTPPHDPPPPRADAAFVAPAEPSPPPTPQEPALLTRLALSAVAIAVAVCVLIDQAGWADVRVTDAIGVGLVIVGVAAVASAFLGRGRGLIALGIVGTLAFGASTAVESIVDDGVGDRRYAPMSIDELEPVYKLGIGDLEVDLTDIEVPAGVTVDVTVELGIGQTTILVSPDTTVEAEGDLGIGELRIFDRVESGLGNELRTTRDASPGSGTLVILLDQGIGEGTIENG